MEELALRFEIGGAQQLTKDASCPGEWVLLSALRRTESGELHALGAKPAQTRVSDNPWLVRVVTVQQPEAAVAIAVPEERKMPESSLEKLKQAFGFSYEHQAATRAPSKMTATQRKGRTKDQEAAEHAEDQNLTTHSWRRPSFAAQEVAGKTYGSAIHAVMQYISYEKCLDEKSVDAQIQELVDKGFVTKEAADMADRKRIADFFATPIGCKLRSGVQLVREFKFSILDDAENYGDGLSGEKVLLQGVVDCAMIEEDGITIIDFKTDYVTEETLPELTEHYSLQVQTYAQAMSRIYQKNVKESCLYFFRLNRFVSV